MKPIAQATLLAAFISSPLLAEVELPSVLGSGMVLQQGMQVPIWGKASAGEKVTVTFSGQSHETAASEDGKWIVKLNPLKTNATGQTLAVQALNKIELTDVLVGEVWLGSGQSNMEWSLSASDGGHVDASAADFPQIRLFSPPHVSQPTPQWTCDATWKACNPENASSFSAVLFYMARELNRELSVPVGVINSSWGGSRIEPWTALEGFAMEPSQRDILRAINSGTPGTEEYKNSMLAWLGNVQQWAQHARGEVDAKKPLSPMPQQPGPPAQGYQGVVGLYHAMIHPLVPFALRGVVWYQGESNLGEGMDYYHRKRALIGGWRKVWGQGDFPFYTVQLAPYNYTKQSLEIDRTYDGLPRIWEAQNATLTGIPNTGVVVTNDIGNFNDIHPTNKKEVGRRLALIALAKEYGKKDLVFSGPVYSTIKPEGAKIRVSFTSIGGGLISRDGKPLREFQLAGDDGKFKDAEAVIEGNEILVSAAKVPSPTQVRFAWNQIPEANLMNKEGLPASAFKSH